MVGPRIGAAANPRIHELHKVLEMTVRDMTEMTKGIDQKFRANEKRLFATEGSSGGQKWPALSKKYAKAKLKQVGRRRIMQRSGRLRKGLTIKGHPDHVARHSSGRVKIGVKSALPAHHGSVAGRQNPRLPKRDVFQMTGRQRRQYYDVVFDRFATKRKQFERAMRAGRAAMRAQARGRSA